MSPRRPSPEHQEAVQRRLALLHAEMRAAAGSTADEVVPVEHPGHADGPVDDSDGSRWPSVPVPGRHADRRPGAWVRDLLDESLPGPLRGRVRLGPAQLTVIALLVAVGLAVTCWWLVRSRPDEVRAPAIEPGPVTLTSGAPSSDASPVSAPAAGGSIATGGGTTPGGPPGGPAGVGSVTVDVAGKVRRPGVVVLDAGSRVQDAIKAAGGARHGVDLTPLNLARVLVDGEQVVVGAAVGVGGPAPPGGGASTGATPTAPGPGGAPLDLNTATEGQLEALPEVGPVTAQSILTWREQHGRFTSVEELLEVDGIGDATLAKLTPYVTV